MFWLQFQDPTRSVILGDRLKQLEELHRLTRPAMEQIFQALWCEEALPTTFFELARHLKEARARIRTWQVSAARKGARQAWAMVQTHFPDLDLEPIAGVGPEGPDGKEVKPDANFKRVMPYARMSEKDCCLKKIID